MTARTPIAKRQNKSEAEYRWPTSDEVAATIESDSICKCGHVFFAHGYEDNGANGLACFQCDCAWFGMTLFNGRPRSAKTENDEYRKAMREGKA